VSGAAAFEVVARAVHQGQIVGAAAAIGNVTSAESWVGGTTALGEEGVTIDTSYDLASLTKVLATTTLLLRAIGEGRIDPREPLATYLPEASWLQTDSRVADATILDLASHSSGLAAWSPLYTLGLDRPTLLARIAQLPLEGKRGAVVYSDLGFILLGYVLERLRGVPLDRQFSDLIAEVGIAPGIGFGPCDAPVAPTEECPWRGRLMRGEVHDENAWAMGGVSGHAGLFGSLAALISVGRALLDGRLLSEPLLGLAGQAHATGEDGQRRGFGWALPSSHWSGGDLFSARAIGHTGFTGTGMWLDLERRLFTILLTNRVYPTRHRESGIVGLRRRFNSAALA